MAILSQGIEIPSYRIPPDLQRFFEPALCGQCYVCHITQIFREARRVLKDDGTCWINLGDSYAGSGGAHTKDHANPGLSRSAERDGVMYLHSNSKGKGTALKPKDLVGIPWMVAFALRADGWYLRSDIIWSKNNPMPESVTDRPTKAHEYIFLLSKSEHYYYDADAIKEPVVDYNVERAEREKHNGNRHLVNSKHETAVGHLGTTSVLNKTHAFRDVSGRNRRTVWTVPTAPYKGAHFATFPPKLIEPCILAGTSAKGVCPECGAPWERVTERIGVPRDVFPSSSNRRPSDDANDARTANSGMSNGLSSVTTIGWRPTCAHNLDPIPATVLDPFAGSGTTGRVAVSLGRKAILIDLKPEYLEMANERTSGVQVQLMPGM